MRKKIYFILFILLNCYASWSQSPDEILTQWSDGSPIEKVYLHLDREEYMAGETIWFKAYLYSEFLPDTISTSLFVELLDSSSQIISRQVFPIFLYSSKGQIELPDSLPAGKYFIRAYSPTMLNQKNDFIYKHGVFVFSKKNNTVHSSKQKEQFIRLEFFPEGGNLVTDLENTVAFKAIDQDGLPIDVSGSVKNEKNATVVAFTSFHDGMGVFDIMPVKNEKYFVTLVNDNGITKYYLPVSIEKGIVIHLASEIRGETFEILQKKDDPAFQAAYLIGQMQHKIVFKQQLNSSLDKIKGVIKTNNLYSGIVQVTVFNKENMPLAERLFFINNKEYIQDASLIPDTINFSTRGKNIFNFSLKDTVTGSFSISVADNDYHLYPIRRENILSTLLLTSDLQGYVDDPAYYFSSDDDSVSSALDLIMMTNGWRRFNWTELLKAPIPGNKYTDQAFITLKGNAKISNTKKDFANQSLMAFITSKDSSSNFQLIKTDGKGNFKLDSLIFFDYTRILFFDIRGKKSKWIDIAADPDSLRRYYPIPALDQQQLISLKKYDSINFSGGPNFYDEYEAFMRARGLTLPEITVKVKKKTALEELEERYVSGLFQSGFATRTIDLMEENIYGKNIFEYIQSRVPGIRLQENGFDYQVFYRGINSLSLGPTPMTIFLDEIQTDANIVAAVPINDIALIKVYDNFVGAWGNGAGGVLAIYTKKGDDLLKDNISQEGNKIYYRGYSIIKQFYSPDYAVDTTIKKGFDRRITLQWIPDILLTGVNPVIPFAFYNTDRTRSFRIVIEGITTAGKMVCIEKIFDADTFRKSF